MHSIAREYVGPHRPHLLLASTARHPQLRLRISRSGALCPRLAPGSRALQQPSDVLIHDKRDARPRQHPDDVRRQAAIKASYALVRPGVRDRGWDGAMVRAREHRVVLPKNAFVSFSCVSSRGKRGEGGSDPPECVSGPLGRGMLRTAPRSSTRPT